MEILTDSMSKYGKEMVIMEDRNEESEAVMKKR